jgi:peptidoglycan/xylan/chitin deacetylase (PgdA/CDA1 family)
MYHDLVEDPVDGTNEMPFRDRLTRAQFAAHLRAIKRHFRAVTVWQAIEEIKYQGDLKENSVAVTFDDGHASIHEIAYPLLKESAVPATVFLVTDWTNGKMTLWWERLADMVEQCNFGEIDRAEIERVLQKGTGVKYERGDAEPGTRKGFLQYVSYRLMQMKEDQRTEILDELKQLFSEGREIQYSSNSSLTWERVRELANSGFEFGAHTCSHINMSHCSLEEAEEEIKQSKEEIESRLGREVKGFSYPYGYDPPRYTRFEPIMEKLKLEYSCTSWWGNNSKDSDPYILLRNVLPPKESAALLGRELHLGMAE